MIELERETFLNDPVFKELYKTIRRNHRVARHTEKILKENRKVKDFCEESRHFCMIPSAGSSEPICVHYDVSSWFKKPNGVQVTIDRIAVYDNFLDYEVARAKQIYSAEVSDDNRAN